MNIKNSCIMDQIRISERKYSELFSKVTEFEWGVRFTDTVINDMYCRNFSRIEDANITDLGDIIQDEIKYRKGLRQKKAWLEKFDTAPEQISGLPEEAEITEHLVMYAPLPELNLKRADENCNAFAASSESDFRAGREVVRLSFGKELEEFAVRQYNNKISIYTDPESGFYNIVCKADGVPVGNADFFITDHTGKIEDFDVLDGYQKKGYGTAILRAAAEKASRNNLDFIFLQVEKNNTAIEMYSKSGFRTAGSNLIISIDI